MEIRTPEQFIPGQPQEGLVPVQPRVESPQDPTSSLPEKQRTSKETLITQTSSQNSQVNQESVPAISGKPWEGHGYPPRQDGDGNMTSGDEMSLMVKAKVNGESPRE